MAIRIIVSVTAFSLARASFQSKTYRYVAVRRFEVVSVLRADTSSKRASFEDRKVDPFFALLPQGCRARYQRSLFTQGVGLSIFALQTAEGAGI